MLSGNYLVEMLLVDAGGYLTALGRHKLSDQLTIATEATSKSPNYVFPTSHSCPASNEAVIYMHVA